MSTIQIAWRNIRAHGQWQPAQKCHAQVVALLSSPALREFSVSTNNYVQHEDLSAHLHLCYLCTF